MKIKLAKFEKSSSKVSQCPKEDKPEFAFIGRSNVGKSSLINMLTNHKGLAKTSGTPGKTQLINHFQINEEWYLVDLPGYGFAKKSKTLREEWRKMINNYFSKRGNLLLSFILIDSRLPLQKVDLEMINWFGENQLPFMLIFTKSDKLGKGRLNKSLASFKKELLEYWEECPEIIISSSEDKRGKNEILAIIESTLPFFNAEEE
jgi:GTP-binding protein